VHHVGILAYGSVIEDPGIEIGPVVGRRITGVMTPFRVEFARKSKTRGGAPTLVPVATAGSQVTATILVLKDEVDEPTAADMLWRRETGLVRTNRRYSRPQSPGPDDVLVEILDNFRRIRVVLYAKISPNLVDPKPEILAELAIASANGPPGDEGRDGISYLLSVQRAGIVTPLLEKYEKEVLRRAGADSLEEARQSSRRVPH